ncbi:MAG: LytR family transcriptional protein [Chloroflexi bacterium]|nr:LytR family transcriptional protein [Chloroflexota bacterium]
MESIETKSTQLNSSRTTKTLRIILIIGFGIAAILVAYLTFAAVRDFVASWEMTNLPGVSIQEVNPPVSSGGEDSGVVSDVQSPLQPPSGPTPEPWDGVKPVTVLVMGLDYRDWISNEGPPRTDTMILLMLDPVNRTAGMLNIPRDLWVNIPGGYNYGRINTAYQLGEAYKLPGGGAGLAMETVEELLGVPIDYYAQIDFSAFERFIDELDGIYVEIPEEIVVDPLGDDNTKRIKPGLKRLSGPVALAYARARKSEGGDFDRAQRQQQVILAIRDRILDLNLLPTLIARAPVLYSELSAGVHTNLNLDQTIKLAWLASQIPEENIKRGAIGADQVAFAVSPDGEQQVLKPITEKVRLLRDEIFTNSGPISPAAANASLEELVKAENARVRILNATYEAGLATRTSDYLKSLGVNVTETGNADQYKIGTEITFYTGKPYTVKYLVDLLKINPLRVYHVNDPTSPVDVTISLGEDWIVNNQMP